MQNGSITNIYLTRNVTMVTIDGIDKLDLIPQILKSIANQNINIDMISQSPSHIGKMNLSFTILTKDKPAILNIIDLFKKKYDLLIDIESNNSKIIVFGEKMKDLPGVAAIIFAILAKIDVAVKLVTTSEIDISFLVDKIDTERTMELLRNELF